MDVHVLELPGRVQVAILDGMLLVDPSVPASLRVLLVRACRDLQAPENQEELDRIIELVYTSAGA
jgi:hypothetical protein